MNLRAIPICVLLLSVGVASAHSRQASEFKQVRTLTPEQAALVEKALGREHILIKEIQKRTPIVETYIQETRPDAQLNQAPVADRYILSRIDFRKAFYDRTYSARSDKKRGFFGGSFAALSNLVEVLGLDFGFHYIPLGFTEMMFLDPYGADQQHYAFSFVRNEFLGSVRTSVFDVQPKVSGIGRFFGRIWIEDQDGNIVRLNGGFTRSEDIDASKLFFHFDSWRTNVQPGIWLPAAVYVQEAHRDDSKKSAGLKAQTHFWGYSLKVPARDGENVTVTVENADDISDGGQDVGPIEASRKWLSQAEDNVVDRLVEAGLVAPLTPDGYETKVLDQIVTNLAIPNNLTFSSPVHCRVMLTTTLEATTIGNTVLVSKGLLDVLPNEESIASILAFELAHVQLGHHIDTQYAFDDRLMFPDEATFQRIAMSHTEHDDDEAAKRAQQYLQASMYSDKLPSAGLFWAQLVERGKILKALTTPRLGDSLLRSDGSPRMDELAKAAPKINWDDLSQIPALPLGSWLKTDPWDDRVQMVSAKRYAPINPTEKMPLEVTPVYYRLQRLNTSAPDRASDNAPTSPSEASPGAPVSVGDATDGSDGDARPHP